MSSFPASLLYCNKGIFGSVDEYERHIVTKHPDLPGYPGSADMFAGWLNAVMVLQALFIHVSTFHNS